MAAKKEKDHRYKTVKILIGAKHIKTFKGIFDHIPKSVIAKELHTNNNRMTDIIEDMAGLRIGEVATIAKLIGVPFMVICGLVDAGMKNGK